MVDEAEKKVGSDPKHPDDEADSLEKLSDEAVHELEKRQAGGHAGTGDIG